MPQAAAPPHSRLGLTTRTDNILSSVASGEGFDVPLKSLTRAPGRQAAAAITSIRGPNVPEVQGLRPEPAGTAGARMPAPKNRAATQAYEKAQMEKAWQSFVAKKGDNLPPLEGNAKSPQPAAQAESLHAHPLREGSNELANKAIEEYDRSAKLHNLNDPHRKYLTAVQTLRNNANALNRDQGMGMKTANYRLSGIRGGNSGGGGSASEMGAKPWPARGGDAKYQPHAKHFGYETPLDFVDSFDPYSDGSAFASGSQDFNGIETMADTSTNSLRAPPPPMATLPDKMVMPRESGPAPRAHGVAAQGSKGSASDLAAQILETTPNFQYTKIHMDGTESGSGMIASRGVSGSESSPPPVEGPFGAKAAMMMKPLPSAQGIALVAAQLACNRRPHLYQQSPATQEWPRAPRMKPYKHSSKCQGSVAQMYLPLRQW